LGALGYDLVGLRVLCGTNLVTFTLKICCFRVEGVTLLAWAWAWVWPLISSMRCIMHNPWGLPHGGPRTLHQKSTFPDVNNLRVLCGTNLVTLPSQIWQSRVEIVTLLAWGWAWALISSIRYIMHNPGRLLHGGLKTFHQKSTCPDENNLVVFAVQIWSRYSQNLGFQG